MICNRKQGNYSDRRICEMLTLIPCNINCFVSSLPRFENSLYTKHVLAYRMKWDIYA
jgi:hypothetical protein